MDVDAVSAFAPTFSFSFDGDDVGGLFCFCFVSASFVSRTRREQSAFHGSPESDHTKPNASTRSSNRNALSPSSQIRSCVSYHYRKRNRKKKNVVHTLGILCSVPTSAASPTLTSAMQNRASSEQSLTSHAHARSTAPPTHAP